MKVFTHVANMNVHKTKNMKQIYILIAAIACGFTSFGQTFQWDTNDTVEVNLQANTTAQYPTYQSAIGQDTVTLAIEIIYNDIPSSWDGMVCIYGACLGTIPPVGTQATMSPISGFTQGMVRLTVNPFNGTETAKLQVYVYDVDHPNDGDTATFLLNGTLSLEESAQLESVLVSPNPATELISFESISGATSATVIDQMGNAVQEIRIDQPGLKTIDITNLPVGMYMIQMRTNQGVSTSRFLKQ